MNETLTAVKAMIKEFTGQANVIAIPRALVRFAGDYESAAMLAQILYWSDRTDDPEGWIYKTAGDWANELDLSPAQVRRVTKRLVQLGIETKFKKNPRHGTAPLWHYRLNWQIFADLFMQFLDLQQPRHSTMCNLDIQQPARTMEVTEPARTMNKESKPTAKPTPTTTGNDAANAAGGGGGQSASAAAGTRAATRQAPPPSPRSAPPLPPPAAGPEPAPDAAATPLEVFLTGLGVGQAAEFRDWPEAPTRAFAQRLAESGAGGGAITNKLRKSRASLLALARDAPAPQQQLDPTSAAERPDWLPASAWERCSSHLRGLLAGARLEAGQVVGSNPVVTQILQERYGQKLAGFLATPEEAHRGKF